jgi:transcriptional regulator with XRE-family HTH domain
VPKSQPTHPARRRLQREYALGQVTTLVKRARQRADLTQQELADLLDLTKGTIAGWERVGPSVVNVLLLCMVLPDLTDDLIELVGRHRPPEPPDEEVRPDER